MAKSTSTETSTETSTGTTEVAESTASIAARRRQGRRVPTTNPAAIPPGAAPAAVAGEAPVAVIASRTLVSSFHTGGPARPVGDMWNGKPLVLEVGSSGFAGVIPENSDYVIAECDAQESMTPPNCYTPVNRTLWIRGQRVRRDLYDAVMGAHAQRTADGTALSVDPAELPAGRDALPADVIATPDQPSAGTTVAGPLTAPVQGSRQLP